VISRRSLLRAAAVGAAGIALPPTLYRVAGIRSAAPTVPGGAVPHRHYVAPTGPSAVTGSTVPLPQLPKARAVGRNAFEPNALGVPGGGYEIPLVLQDRQFDSSGQLFYSPDSTWLPEFFGNTPLVNGAAQPYLTVEPRIYRFRILNASNARFWNLTIQGGPPTVQIGSDGGLFSRPVPVTELLLLPAERADVLVDFSRFAGRTLTVTNPDLPADVSSPAPPLPTVMEIRVGTRVTLAGPRSFPTVLPGSMPALGAPSVSRTITLEEVENPDTGEPEYGSLNGRKFDDPRGVQEQPRAGATEDWRLVNLTEDTHPIHLPGPVPGDGPDPARRGRVRHRARGRPRRQPGRAQPRSHSVPDRTGGCAGPERTRLEGHRPDQPRPGHPDPDALDAARRGHRPAAVRLPLPHPRARGQLDDAAAAGRGLTEAGRRGTPDPTPPIRPDAAVPTRRRRFGTR
jgi:hypothetical protein